MSITTINATDRITDSRAVINDNFTALNSDKIESSVIDTDTTLAADSDAKLPSQKAVKAYVDSGGNPNASETERGLVQEATDAQVTAGTATGSTGAKLVVTPAKLATRLGNIVNVLSRAIGVNTAHSDNEGSENITITHNLGFIPTRIYIKAITQYYNSNAPTNTVPKRIATSDGVYLSGSYACVYTAGVATPNNTDDWTYSATDAVAVISDGTKTQKAVITNVGTTTFRLDWTGSGAMGVGNTIKVLWEASL